MAFLMNEFLCPTNWHRLQLISFLIQNKNAEKQNSMVMFSQTISEEKFNTAVYIYNWNDDTSAVLPDAKESKTV